MFSALHNLYDFVSPICFLYVDHMYLKNWESLTVIGLKSLVVLNLELKKKHHKTVKNKFWTLFKNLKHNIVE